MITDIALDEIQQVYFGLKTDDVTYFSFSTGDDYNNGLSINFPKKNLTSANLTTKYAFIIDGIYSSTTVQTFSSKIFIGQNLGICKISGNLLTTQYMNRFLDCEFYNLTLNLYAYQASTSSKIYNCIVEDLGMPYPTNLGIIIKNSHIIKSNGNNLSTLYTISNLTTSLPSSSFYCKQVLTDYLNPELSLIKNLGDPVILNPDGNRCNIGITGGPYYFDGFNKNINVLGNSNVDVTIDTINNLFSLSINQININPNIPNISNGIVQKLYKITETDKIHLIDKTIDVNTGQVTSTTIPLE